jgi:hypothetical protein
MTWRPEPEQDWLLQWTPEHEWWEVVFFEGEWNVTDEMIVTTIGPEYYFALDRGLQP